MDVRQSKTVIIKVTLVGDEIAELSDALKYAIDNSQASQPIYELYELLEVSE